MSYITKNMIRKNAKNTCLLTLLHKDFFAWTYTKYYSSSPLNHMKESPSSFTVHIRVRSFLEGHSALDTGHKPDPMPSFFWHTLRSRIQNLNLV